MLDLNRTYLKILDMRKSPEKGDAFAHMPAWALLQRSKAKADTYASQDYTEQNFDSPNMILHKFNNQLQKNCINWKELILL